MKRELLLKKYQPRWYIFYLFSIIIHFILVILIFLNYPRSLELKVKEVKINLISQTKQEEKQQKTQEIQPIVRQQNRIISKKEVDDLIFEIVAPKISKSPLANVQQEVSPTSPTREILPTERKLSEARLPEKDLGSPTIKETKSDTLPKAIPESKESLDISSVPTASRKSTSENLTGNIKWIKGGPRKVIEWYSPEIPPNILKKETDIVLIFYIEPSGFVSRVEISKTSGEPLIDEIISKTMRRIRFNPESYSTIASVSLTIIPK